MHTQFEPIRVICERKIVVGVVWLGHYKCVAVGTVLGQFTALLFAFLL